MRAYISEKYEQCIGYKGEKVNQKNMKRKQKNINQTKENTKQN